jgi:small-conductance mechanosensitive channel
MPERFFDPYRLIQAKLVSIWNSFFMQLPNLLGAVLFMLVLWLLTRLIRRWVEGMTRRRQREDLGELLSSIATFAVMLLGLLISTAIIFPSVSPSGILSTLGFGSVAVGFAFRDILQNLFAGVLIVINRPFRTGDVIAMDKYEGTVQRVEARATIIRTADGRRIAVPNSLLYTSPVTINTANSQRRDEIEVVLAPGQAVEAIGESVAAELGRVEGVLDKPGPEMVGQAIAADGLHAVVRWWTPTRGVDRQAVRAAAVAATARAIAAASSSSNPEKVSPA